MLLKVGSRGDDVAQVQAKLGLDTDGIFGSGTGQAVKDWQSANGLDADGIIGNDSWGLLFSTDELLKVGSRGDEVARIQAKLGLDDDGVFGSGTAEAVKAWQSANGLTADGLVGKNTKRLLFAGNSVAAAPVSSEPVADVGDLQLSKLQGHIPDAVIAQIPDCAEKFQINTPLRLAHFLAQCSHESAGFKATQENLNYSSSGLKGVFGKYFPGNLAESYHRQPEKIASRVYADRMGNGNEASKEGYKYRGRGYIQLTGKSNYSSFNKSVSDDVVSNPDLVASKYALLSAAWYWNSRSLNRTSDGGSSDSVVTSVTKKVNGGTIGLADRIEKFKKYYSLLS